MESTKKPLSPSDYDDDKDINFILYKVGVETKKVFLRISRILATLVKGFQLMLLFLLKNMVWLLLGAIIGLGYGYYHFKKNGPKYSSEMVVQTNFNSARTLYGVIDHLNILIGSGNSDLSRILNISPEEASRLYNFSIEPVKSELIVADLYQETFLQKKIGQIRQDTFWTRTLPYKKFKESLSLYDYPMHTISAISYNSDIFGKIQSGIVNLVANNGILQKIKQAESENNREDIRLLTSAIEDIDTLRLTYNQRLLKDNGMPAFITGKLKQINDNIIFTAPELELYDQLHKLKEELKTARTRSVLENNIVEVYSGFNSPGKLIPLINEKIFPCALIGVVLTIAIILFFRFIKFFVAYKKNGNK